ncbi:MAG: sugar transferase [Bacteroidales bacterium]|nr:sugar transferase [Bacteroidales bacterium]
MSAKEIRKKALSTAAKRLKRAFDVLVALCGLLVFSPAFVVLYFVIRHEDGGPAIFRQERIGRGGRPFMLYKFRSMTVTAEKDGPALYVKGDKRLTKVGRFLREHHLDELPQLWNVLKGDMSVVGYRPERQFFVEKIMAVNPDYERLYEMRPGLFSSATLYNGYTDTLEKMLERLRMDLEYLGNWNLWLDIKIIFLTSMSIITGKKF